MIKGQDFGYDKNDFRDPFVFKGDDGKFHMLISTKKGGKGSLAEFVSDDLKNWTDNGVFMTMMWDRFTSVLTSSRWATIGTWCIANFIMLYAECSISREEHLTS